MSYGELGRFPFGQLKIPKIQVRGQIDNVFSVCPTGKFPEKLERLKR